MSLINIYIFNLISILLYSGILLFLNEQRSINNKKLYKLKIYNYSDLLIIIITIQLFFISSLRSRQIGIDLKRYIPRFYLIARTEWGSMFSLRHKVDFEYGYILYNKIISIFFNHGQMLIVITSAIIMISFAYFIKKYSKIPWLSFFLFITLAFYGRSFNVLRQYIAMSILIFSIKYIKERQLLKFLICITIAMSIHTTAFVFIILYPMYNIRISYKYLISFSIFSSIIGFSSRYIIYFGLKYTQYDKFIQKIGSGLGNGTGEGMLIVLIGVIVGMLIFKNNFEHVDNNSRLWFHMLLIAIFFNILSLNLAVFERVMRYFMIAMIVSIPNTIYSVTDKKLKYIGIIAVLVLTSLYYFNIVMIDYSSSSGIIPYRFMWQ